MKSLAIFCIFLVFQIKLGHFWVVYEFSEMVSYSFIWKQIMQIWYGTSRLVRDSLTSEDSKQNLVFVGLPIDQYFGLKTSFTNVFSTNQMICYRTKISINASNNFAWKTNWSSNLGKNHVFNADFWKKSECQTDTRFKRFCLTIFIITM